MTAPKLSDERFIDLFTALGPEAMSRRDDTPSLRNIYARRNRLEKIYGPIESPRVLQQREQGGKGRLHCEVKNGVVLVGADPHYWPGIISTAHAAMVRFCEELKPKAVVMNGDVVDGAEISRHARIGWEYRPHFADELEAVQARLDEIERASGRAKKYWPLGNHDARMETLIASRVPELERVHGVHLKDHFNKVWNPCWSLWINDNTVIKHRFKGGMHAAFNNTLWSGKSIVTGHLHRGVVHPFTDYSGTRYGVDMPWMGENHGPQVVDYTEDNPVNWRSGIAVLTYIDGVLCQPELAFVVDTGVIEFRGKHIRV